MSLREGKERVQITLTHELVEKIESTSKKIGISKSDLIALAVLQYINSLQNPFPLD